MPILRLVMFLITTVWVLLLPILTSPKLRAEGASEICCAPARAEKNVIQDKRTEKPHLEPKIFTAHTFSCAQRAAQRGDWCGVSPDECVHEEMLGVIVCG